MADADAATSDTEITVTWGSPASDGGADITGYMVQRAYMGADNMMSDVASDDRPSPHGNGYGVHGHGPDAAETAVLLPRRRDELRR